MKVLMRADTHVTFSIPENAPKAKCTASQVRPSLTARSGVSFRCGIVTGDSRPFSVFSVYGCWFRFGVHIPSRRIYER